MKATGFVAQIWHSETTQGETKLRASQSKVNYFYSGKPSSFILIAFAKLNSMPWLDLHGKEVLI